jgi:hypothetical protein
MTENTGFEAYRLYSALKLHFTSSSYDYFKYNGKTNVSQESFLKRKDKYSFYKLSRKYTLDELQNFYVANFVYGDSSWVGEMTGPSGEDTYKKWQKINQSLTYQFENDTVNLIGDEPADKMLAVHDGQHPRLLTEVMSGNISIETMVILNDIMNFFPMWNKKIGDDIIWPTWCRKCERYTPFVSYDKSKFIKLLKEIVTEHA